MADSFDRFSVFFTPGTVYVSGKEFPLGQLTTDILNLDNAVLAEIDRRINDFMSAVAAIFTEKTGRKCISNLSFLFMRRKSCGWTDHKTFNATDGLSYK